MTRERKLRPIPGAVVRLTHDVRIKGGVWFRAGLRMTLTSDAGCFFLTVRVRGRTHHLQLQKKDYPFYFTVLTNPEPRTPEEEAVEHRADEGTD